MLKPFQKLQFSQGDTAALRTDLLNKLSGGLATLFQSILSVIGEATVVPILLQATVDFGTAATTPEAVTATIADNGVTAASKINVSVAPAAGRDMDEMELGPVIAGWGNVVPGVSFDVIVVADDGTAHGAYTVNAVRT